MLKVIMTNIEKWKKMKSQ